MPTKPKPIPYNKGDKVIIINGHYYNHLRVDEAVVSVVRRQEGIVHTQSVDMHQNVWKRAFSIHMQPYGEDPWPIWMLQPHPGDEAVKRMRKRLKLAAKQFEDYRQKADEIRRQVDWEAKQWASAEETKRVAQLPHNSQYVDRVMRRWGFKKPTNKN